jgi:hypothetical protein
MTLKPIEFAKLEIKISAEEILDDLLYPAPAEAGAGPA